MKKKEERNHNWVQMLQNHQQTCGQVKVYLEKLENACEAGEDVAVLVRQLRKVTLQACREAEQLCEVLFESPVRRIFSADRVNVTEQQLQLARAAGLDCFTAKSLGVSPITDYEAYRLCVYEDDQIVWFWHPDEPPPSPPRHEGNTITVRGRAALSPEEVDPDHLRPEQIEFFTKYRPDVLPRLGLLKQNHNVQPDPEVAASPHGRDYSHSPRIAD